MGRSFVNTSERIKVGLHRTFKVDRSLLKFLKCAYEILLNNRTSGLFMGVVLQDSHREPKVEKFLS